MRIRLIIPVLITLLSVSVGWAAPSISFVAGTTAGWDFYDLQADLAKNNTVDWNDLGVIASHWLNTGCSDVNQWCAGADLDSSTAVDLLDYALLSKDWNRQGAKNVLLQTIYGTNQDADGTIIPPSTTHAIQSFRGKALAFVVPNDTVLDKAIFKVVNPSATKTIQVRFYNVTGRGYITGTTVTRSDPGGIENSPIFTATTEISNPALSHPEGAQNVADLIVNFDNLAVTAGEYFLTFDCIAASLTTGYSAVRGASATEIDIMGEYGNGASLPKRAVVSITGTPGNNYHYELSNSTTGSYSGRSYQMAFQITIANRPPTVNAGINQTVQYPDIANLSGTASDDGFPDPPAAFITAWSKVSGPGTVTFGNTSALNTTAEFSEVGTYVLRLTANDGALSSQDDVTIIYTDNHAPVANAGTDATIGILDGANLDGTVTDDGLPNPPGTFTTLWTQESGPGTAAFGNANAVDTSVSFSATGTYVLKLTADDSDMITYDEVTIEVAAGSLNNAPAVNAGTDQSVDEGITVNLNGTVSDDGKPNPPASFTTLWTKQSGPGTVTFGNAINIDTTANFSLPGTYILRLTANDTQLQAYDEVTITVKAFGSYEGYGAGATGGAGGTVITVTNLNASGGGSLQAAMSATGARIIKFDPNLSGRIIVSSALSLSNGNVTIKGSTAASPGITIDGDNVSYRALDIDCSNVIIENIRFRNTQGELVLVSGGNNMVFDHCSFTWNGDGALDLNGTTWGAGVNHITINRCLFGGSEELSRSHGHQITWMYNLMTSCNRRQPKIALGGPDYNLQCNYIRKWCNTATHIEAGEGGINVINNYYGPPYPTEDWNVACYNSTVDPNFIYASGNEHAPDAGDHPPRGSYNANDVGAALAPLIVEAPPVPVTIIDALDVPASVLASVGAKPTDSHDAAWITGSYTGRDHTIGGNGP